MSKRLNLNGFSVDLPPEDNAYNDLEKTRVHKLADIESAVREDADKLTDDLLRRMNAQETQPTDSKTRHRKQHTNKTFDIRRVEILTVVAFALSLIPKIATLYEGVVGNLLHLLSNSAQAIALPLFAITLVHHLASAEDKLIVSIRYMLFAGLSYLPYAMLTNDWNSLNNVLFPVAFAALMVYTLESDARDEYKTIIAIIFWIVTLNSHYGRLLVPMVFMLWYLYRGQSKFNLLQILIGFGIAQTIVYLANGNGLNSLFGLMIPVAFFLLPTGALQPQTFSKRIDYTYHWAIPITLVLACAIHFLIV